MKVLLIDVNCKYSSTGKIVYDLFEGMKQKGHEVAICYGRGEEVKEEGIYKFGLDFETVIHAGLSRITGLNGYFSYLSTRRLIRFIEEFRPDIIHIHELHAYFVNIRQLIEYLKLKGIKTIWTFHCEYMYTGKCGYAYECSKYISGCERCPLLREYPKSFCVDQTGKMYEDKKKLLQDWDFTIVTPSKWLAERVVLSFLKNKKIMVINNGIDTQNIFYPRNEEQVIEKKKEFGLENKKIVLSVVPNMADERKGGRMVLKLAEILESSDIQFVIVGADKTEKITRNVQLVQKTKKQEELAIWYSLADVFLICSRCENFPTSCLEALSCGTPIVGIDQGGTKETAPIPYGEFVMCDEKVLKEGIMKQLRMEYNRKEISNIAKNLYSKEVMFQKYYELYTTCD